MNPNQRLLQVVNSANPSLRTAAMPFIPSQNLGPIMNSQSQFSIGSGIQFNQPAPTVQAARTNSFTPPPSQQPFQQHVQQVNYQPQNQSQSPSNFRPPSNTNFNPSSLYTGAPAAQSVINSNNPNFGAQNANSDSVGRVASVIASLASPLKGLAEPIARLFPGGQNDSAAENQAIDQNNQERQFINNLYNTGKISAASHQKLIGLNTSHTNQTSQDVNQTAKEIKQQTNPERIIGGAAYGVANILGGGLPEAFGVKALGGKAIIDAGVGGLLGGSAVAGEGGSKKQVAAGTGVGAISAGLLRPAGKVFNYAKGLFTKEERQVLSEAGIDAAAPVEAGGLEPNQKQPSQAETDLVKHAEQEAGKPNERPASNAAPNTEPASTPETTPAPVLTPEQQHIITEFPNGLDKPAITALKKQGYTDDLIAQMKQQVDDVHTAAGTPPEQLHQTTKQAEAPKVATGKQVESQKVAEAQGEIAVPSGEHYLDQSTGKSVPIDTMHPKYAKNAFAKMEREHPELVDSPVGQALKARSESSGTTKPVSDIPGTSKTESKLQSKRIAEARLKGNALETTGPELRAAIHAHEVNMRSQLQQVWDHIKPYTDLNKADRTLAREVVAGRATTDNPTIQTAADRVREALQATRQQGVESGLDVGNRGPNYIPEKLPDLKRKSNLNAAIKHLVDSGQATDETDAVRKLTQFQADNSLTQNKFAHYQKRTVDVPGEATHQALMDYFRKGTETNSLAKTFGPTGEGFNVHVANAASRGEDAGALKGIIGDYLHPRQAEGLGAGTTRTLQKVMRPLQLKAAAISHLPQQFANTSSSVGYKAWAKGVEKGVLDPEMKQFLHDSGLSSEDFGHHADAADKATAPGLSRLLAKWREFSGASGRIIAQGLARKGDVAGLKDMLVSGPLKTAEDGSIQLTREQEMQAAHYQADKDIGSHSNIQNTSWSKTTAGRAWGNYMQAYVFKQSERITDMAREARAGNVAPLVRYLAVGAPAGGAVITVGKEEYKQPGVNPLADPKKLLEGTIKNSGIGTIGYGLADKAYNAVTHNYSNDARWQTAANAVGGSLAGTAVETGQNIAKATHGNTSPLKKEGIGLIPAPGTGYLTNKFAPTKQSPYNTPNFQPKTVADLKALNSKTAKDFVQSLSPQDKKNFTDSKGYFIDYNTATEAHNQGILSDAQYTQYNALHKVLEKEQGKTTYNSHNLDQALAKGQITQTQYDLTKAYEQKQANLTSVGKNVVSKAAPDPTQKAIADDLNRQLPPGLSKLQADPDLAKSYAAFAKATADNANKAPEDQETAIDLNDRKIKFWAQAAKDGAPSNVQSVYRDGGNKAAQYIKQGKATVDDLNQAVGLDNMLLAAGLITQPKFSKTWRATNGYPSAATFMPGGSSYGTQYVAQALSTPNSTITATGSGSGGSGRSGFGNNLVDLGNGTFGSVNKKTGAVSLKGVQSDSAKGTTGGVVDPGTGLFIAKPIGLTKLLNTKDSLFRNPGISAPSINTRVSTPKLKSFAAPNVRGTPRQQRAVPIRFSRIKFKS